MTMIYGSPLTPCQIKVVSSIEGKPTVKGRPSTDVKRTVAPQSASTNGTLALYTRSFPSLLNLECGFSSITNTRSADVAPGRSSPVNTRLVHHWDARHH